MLQEWQKIGEADSRMSGYPVFRTRFFIFIQPAVLVSDLQNLLFHDMIISELTIGFINL